MIGVLGIDGFVLNSESLSSMLPVTLFLELLELLRAFCKSIHHFLTSFIGEKVDQATGGLSDNLLSAFMFFEMISRVIVDLLQNIIICKY